MITINKFLKSVIRSVRVFFAKLSPTSPVYVFHHIPKCGGTSVRRLISHWFIVIMDYRNGHTANYPIKTNLRQLRSAHCLCGHFELNGYHLHQRYPEVFFSPRYRVFSFIRNPLDLSLSLYRYLKDTGHIHDVDINTHLFLRQNILAKCFCVNEDNYKERLDKYFFIGILEKQELSIELLTKLVGKKSIEMTYENISRKRVETEIQNLPNEIRKKFRKENKLDYLIYDYVLEKFNRHTKLMFSRSMRQ